MKRSASIHDQLSLSQWLHQGALAGLLAVLVPVVGVTLLHQALAITHRFPLDYGEAPLVDQAMRLAAGQNIYRPDLSAPPYTISNYPPLYVAALAPWTALFGPSFAPGRLLSTLCAWVAAGCLALILHTHSRDRWAALLTGLMFVTLSFVTHWSAFLRVDMLALALSLLALTVLVRWPGVRSGFWVAGLLLVAAIFTRQSYALAAPAAAFVWLWVTAGFRRALALAALVGGLSLGLFALLQLATGGGFFFNIVTANVNEYRQDILIRSLELLRDNAWPLLVLGAIALGLGCIRAFWPAVETAPFGPAADRPPARTKRQLMRGASLWPKPSDVPGPLYILAAVYLVGGALSALTIGKIGSNVNYLLELCAGLSLAAGGVLGWVRQPARSGWLAAGVLVLLAVQSFLSLRLTLNNYAGELGNRRGQTRELYELEALVRDAQGPVLADEYMGLSTLVGRPLYMQPFEVTQLARAGAWDQTPLVDSLGQQAFDLILLYDQDWSRERWTPEMLAAIESEYRLTARLADTRVYRPFDRQAVLAADTCPGAAWRLPTEAARGLQGEANGLMFFGDGSDGALPVLALADGRLTRRADWFDAVAIEHDDPLRPGATVWVYYADLAGSNGLTSHIAPEFPLGVEGAPVHAGQVVGYQGTWSGRKLWAAWVHARVALVRGPAQGVFPDALKPEVMLDPAPYFNLDAGALASGKLQPLRCAGP